MPEFVRVRDNDTKHEYTVVASAVDPEAHTVLDEPALDETEAPLPPKHHESKQSSNKSGQKAATEKES